MRITKLRLKNWRNFSDVDVCLQHRVFLVGPNASGKSNFLDAVRFLRDVVDVGGGFAEAVRRRGGISAVRCLAARRQPVVVLRISVGDGDSPEPWQYELAFGRDKAKNAVVKRERVWRDGDLVMARPGPDDEADPERLRQTHLEQVNVNREFRPIAEFLRTVRYQHIVPQLVREPDRMPDRPNDPFGSDFLERIASTPKRTRAARLRKISEALRVAVPQLTEVECERDERGIPHLRGRYEHWRPQGAWQDEGQLSDGTLRLLGLLWSVQDGAGPLLLEEPELSLHPDLVRHLPSLFARVQSRSQRQVVLSTHAPELLRDEGIGLDEVLLLLPQAEGTRVRAASGFREIKELLDGGLSLPEAVMPLTRPTDSAQLCLFDGA